MSESQIFEMVLPVLAPVLVGWLAVRLKLLAVGDAKALTSATAKMAFAIAESHGVYERAMAAIVTITTLSMLVMYPIFSGFVSGSGRQWLAGWFDLACSRAPGVDLILQEAL